MEEGAKKYSSEKKKTQFLLSVLVGVERLADGRDAESRRLYCATT
jgi:hypothetical protein